MTLNLLPTERSCHKVFADKRTGQKLYPPYLSMCGHKNHCSSNIKFVVCKTSLFGKELITITLLECFTTEHIENKVKIVKKINAKFIAFLY